MTNRYSSRFQQKDAVEAYEAGEYGAESYSTFIWQLQRPVLEGILKDFRRQNPGTVRLLDFACGTGRVLSALEPLVDSAEGIDISENMVAVARTRCNKARFVTGDVLTQPKLLPDACDIISCFRFVLNAEPELRGSILRLLRGVLREPHGLLLINVHGNSSSLRHPAILWRRRRERNTPGYKMLNEMSPLEAERLLVDSGFEIVHRYGFGILPPMVYRTPLRRVANSIDRWLCGENWLSRWSIDLLFVCRAG
jgi:SAM-dependent methyltransferase